MNLILTNTGAAPLPVMSTDGGGWADSLPPGGKCTYDRADTDVIIVGDKPSVTEQIAQGFETIKQVVAKAIELWKKTPTPVSEKTDSAVQVTVENHGANSVRAILGDGVTDHEIKPGDSYVAASVGYLELRELGKAPQQGGTPD